MQQKADTRRPLSSSRTRKLGQIEGHSPCEGQGKFADRGQGPHLVLSQCQYQGESKDLVEDQFQVRSCQTRSGQVMSDQVWSD